MTTRNDLETVESTEASAASGDTLNQIIERRLDRRSFLQFAALGVAAVGLGQVAGKVALASPAAAGEGFTAIKPVGTFSAKTMLPQNYTSAMLIRWGDPVVKGAPAFDPKNLTKAAQEKQFGYNCDFIGFVPMKANASDTGLLVVNHEYTSPELMWKNYKASKTTKDIVDVELAAHGISIVEVQRGADGAWKYLPDSKYNRRITAYTPIKFSGPAVGADLLKTKAEPTGTTVLGTLNNCAGGKTPWGTILAAEENFHQYFANVDQLDDKDPVKALHKRYGVPGKGSERNWESIYDRFDVTKDPNEPFRHGWIVEVDPSDPTSTPVKHTALGRFKHEAATISVGSKGQLAAYLGDDERFEYVYKFVPKGTYDPAKGKANSALLTEGTLYVAKFNDNGSGEWLPLVQGQGPLTEKNGFKSQADVLIKTRIAGDLVGATKMDRPEDMELNPVNKKVYLALTNNTQRGAEGKPGPDAANPRAPNRAGHIIELTEDGDDPAATKFEWEIFLLCGDPAKEDAAKPETETYFAGYDKTKVSPIGAPDNVAFDNAGNLWIATDGQPSAIKYNDALHMVPTAGSERGHVQQFFSSTTGSEVCGPEFTPDNKTLFLAVQHPGEGGLFEMPTTRWPDNNRNLPPRPSVIVVTHKQGKVIGEA
jgi:hypothetical protein